jgi:hypothetical protein
VEGRARSAAEEAIRALGRHDPASARTFISAAVDLDPSLGPMADIVFLACQELEADGEVSESTWNALADAVAGEGLFAVVEGSRTR